MWLSLPDLHARFDDEVEDEWDGARAATEAMMWSRHEGGGMMGLDPIVHVVKAGLVADGTRALAERERAFQRVRRSRVSVRRR
jgi:hypothetical protein